jgi:hypothetical protein
VKPRELATLLRLLDKHPRVTSITVQGVSVQLTEAPASFPEGSAEDAGGDLELPPGVPDPRDAIKAIYAKALKRDGKVPS